MLNCVYTLYKTIPSLPCDEYSNATYHIKVYCVGLQQSVVSVHRHMQGSVYSRKYIFGTRILLLYSTFLWVSLSFFHQISPTLVSQIEAICHVISCIQ